MTVNPIPILQLKSRCKARFREFGMCDKQIDSYDKEFLHLISYMENEGYTEYTPEVCESYLQALKEDVDKCASRKRRDGTLARMACLVVEGKPYNAIRSRRVSHDIPETEFGRIAKAYVQKLFDDGQLRKATVNQYQYYLSYLAIAMQLDNVDLSNLCRSYILKFLDKKPALTTRKVAVIKVFLHYLYENGYTREDLSLALKAYKMPKAEKVISYYTPEEIQQVEQSIDRSTNTGKRDYAIILLASRLGLRSGDICHLTFSDIDWDECKIRIRQQKTGRLITLPLLEDVGEAIIDYVTHARPKTEIKHVFVTKLHPYKPLNSVATMVNERISKSGICTIGKHHGAHSLRHSLATAMMSQKNDLPVISSALGHVMSKSTMFYLGVNIDNLLECSHDVPGVNDSFYTQKGGVFYDR